MAQQLCTGAVLADKIESNIMRMHGPHPTRLADIKRPVYALPLGVEQAFHDYFLLHGNSSNVLIWPRAEWNNESPLSALVKMVDDMFFDSTLSCRVPVFFARQQDRIKAVTSRRPKHGAASIWIEIDLHKSDNCWKLLWTLIHEMAHACIMLHTCYCGSPQCFQDRVRLDHVGVTGHGGYWQRLTLAIECLMRELGHTINLGRDDGADHELGMRNDPTGAEDYLRATFVDYKAERKWNALCARRLRYRR